MSSASSPGSDEAGSASVAVSPRPSWLAKLALAAFSIAIALIGAELVLRVAWGGFYLKGAEPYAQPHPTRGWSNRPGVQVPYGEPEFSISVGHDSRGYRGAEVAPQKDGRTRVLLLGDSFTYGIGVEDDETFAARLMQLEPRIEAINTGVNGYGTGQELLLLKEEGLALEPDVVVVSFFWNDVANNVERDQLKFSLMDGNLVYPPRQDVLPAVSGAATHSWLRYSYLYRFSSDRLKTLRFWWKLQLGMDHESGDRVPPEQRERAWEIETALLREIRDVCNANGIKLLLVVIPEQVQVQPDAKVLGLVKEEYEIQERLLDIAAREQITVLDLLPPLREHYLVDREPLYYRVDRHFMPRAHQLAAELILEQLRERGWLGRLDRRTAFAGATVRR